MSLDSAQHQQQQYKFEDQSGKEKDHEIRLFDVRRAHVIQSGGSGRSIICQQSLLCQLSPKTNLLTHMIAQ
jgi:hypothetical protein